MTFLWVFLNNEERKRTSGYLIRKGQTLNVLSFSRCLYETCFKSTDAVLWTLLGVTGDLADLFHRTRGMRIKNGCRAAVAVSHIEALELPGSAVAAHERD